MPKQSTRQRIETPAYRTWDDVNAALREVGEIDLQIEALEADCNRKIADAKAELEVQAQALLERKDTIGRLMKEFAEARRADFSGKKSLPLTFGQVGFRQSTKIILRNVKAIIEALKRKKMLDCVIIEEKVSKDALGGYDDATLSSVGAKRQTEDVFWYEVDRERVQPKPLGA